jgi:hypothetical protein
MTLTLDEVGVPRHGEKALGAPRRRPHRQAAELSAQGVAELDQGVDRDGADERHPAQVDDDVSTIVGDRFGERFVEDERGGDVALAVEPDDDAVAFARHERCGVGSANAPI